MDKVHQFYTLKPWRDLSYNLKIAAGGKCNRCDFQVVNKEDFKYLIGHHKVELDESNVDDPQVSLNPELIEIICHRCHNKEHRRFGNKKNVYIVYGSPLSGKSTLVREIMQYGDIVLDMDALWQAVSFQDEYIKPKNVRFNIFKLRDELLDQVKTRYGNWYDAYIIGGYPDKYERERLSKELGAELIYVESTRDECMDRLEKSGKPDSWRQYIDDWFEKYNG